LPRSTGLRHISKRSQALLMEAVAAPLPAADENADAQLMGAPAARPAPRIDATNAAAFMPPSLNCFRTAASRAAPDSAPAVWYQQMTGRDWDRGSHSYELEKKRHRRLLDEHKIAERERDRKRKRGDRRYSLACIYKRLRRYADRMQHYRAAAREQGQLPVQLLQRARVADAESFLESARFLCLINDPIHASAWVNAPEKCSSPMTLAQLVETVDTMCNSYIRFVQECRRNGEPRRLPRFGGLEEHEQTAADLVYLGQSLPQLHARFNTRDGERNLRFCDDDSPLHGESKDPIEPKISLARAMAISYACYAWIEANDPSAAASDAWIRHSWMHGQTEAMLRSAGMLCLEW